MSDDTLLPFDLPSVRRKKLTVDFDGGNQSLVGGLLLLREAERKLGVCRWLAEAMPDRRDPDRVRHAIIDVMARASAIACGYEDDRLRHDPLMKVAVGRCPETEAPVASQSTISRLENAPRLLSEQHYRATADVRRACVDGVRGRPVDLASRRCRDVERAGDCRSVMQRRSVRDRNVTLSIMALGAPDRVLPHPVRPSATLANPVSAYDLLPSGVPLLKQVAAIGGDRVCRLDWVVFLDGKAVAQALDHDAAERLMPAWDVLTRARCRRRSQKFEVDAHRDHSLRLQPLGILQLTLRVRHRVQPFDLPLGGDAELLEKFAHGDVEGFPRPLPWLYDASREQRASHSPPASSHAIMRRAIPPRREPGARQGCLMRELDRRPGIREQRRTSSGDARRAVDGHRSSTRPPKARLHLTMSPTREKFGKTFGMRSAN